MKKQFSKMCNFLQLVTLMCSATSALAIPITFTAFDFEPLEVSGPPPQEIVTGSFDYTLSPTNFFTLNSVSLQIVDKNYTLDDISVIQNFSAGTVMIGSATIPGGITFGVDNFGLEYGLNGVAEQFLYSIEAPMGDPRFGAWHTDDVLVQRVSVPEPGMLLLLCMSLAGLALVKTQSPSRLGITTA